MADLENATPFGAVRRCRHRIATVSDVLLIVVAAQFELPEPGDDGPRLRLFRTQELPPMADEYVGEPGQSSIRRDGQSVVHEAGDRYLRLR